MSTERVLQQKVLKYIQSNNMLGFKTDSTSARGWPDLTIILDGGEVHFLEIKTPPGKLSEHQKRIHKQLTEKGAKVYVIRTLQEVQTLYPPDT